MALQKKRAMVSWAALGKVLPVGRGDSTPLFSFGKPYLEYAVQFGIPQYNKGPSVLSLHQITSAMRTRAYNLKSSSSCLKKVLSSHHTLHIAAALTHKQQILLLSSQLMLKSLYPSTTALHSCEPPHLLAQLNHSSACS